MSGSSAEVIPGKGYIEKMKGYRIPAMERPIWTPIPRELVIGHIPTWFQRDFPLLQKQCALRGGQFPMVVPLDFGKADRGFADKFWQNDLRNVNEALGEHRGYQFGRDAQYVMLLALSAVSKDDVRAGKHPVSVCTYGIVDQSLLHAGTYSDERLAYDYSGASNSAQFLASQSLEIIHVMRNGKWPETPYTHTQPLAYAPVE